MRRRGEKSVGGSKDFHIALGHKKRALQGLIEEQRSFSSWVALGPASLGFLLEGFECAFPLLKEQQWHCRWKEEGRRYSLTKDEN